MKIVFHDTETTGVDQADRILQSAYSIYEIKNGKLIFLEYMEENIIPPVPINPSAAAVHGIWYPDLINAPLFEESQTKKDFERFIKEGYYYCAHNAPFDLGMMEKEGIVFDIDYVIDTLKIAKALNIDNSDIKSNGLQYLRYFYNFDMDENFTKFLEDYKITKLIPHTALSDIAVLAYYFKFIFESGMVNSLDECVKYTLTPTPEKEIKFGNVFEKGTTFYDAAISTYEQYGKRKPGLSYLNWAINNMETLSADVKIGISVAVVNAIRDGKISFENPEAMPMKIIAASFDKGSREFLLSKGINKSIILKTIETIHKKIETIKNSGIIDESKDYPNLLTFIKYYEYLERN